jgi:acetolactate synthase-1/2/3 large subunit
MGLNMVASQNLHSVSHVIADELHRFGVTDIFCVVGGAIAPLTEVFAQDSRFEVHYLLHEQSAGIAAESYCATSGKSAVLLVTSGPGSTNAMTPLVAAWTNSSPVIILAGQVRSLDVQLAGNNRQWGSQHIDSIAMVSPFTKVARRIDADSVQAHFPQDLRLSTSGRPGPVWFEIPSDVQRSNARQIYRTELTSNQVDIGNIVKFIKVLDDAAKHSKKPLVLMGNGCRSSLNEVLHFVRKLNWPVQLTWPALDFITIDDDLYVGRPGSISTWGANLTIQNADLVLILGARLDWGQVAFRPENFAHNAKLFRVEVDAEELRRIPAPNVVDACTSIADFLNAADNSDLALNASKVDVTPWRNQVAQWKTKLNDFGSKLPTSDLSMYELIECISSQSSRFETVVSGSSGTCTEQVMQAFAPMKNQRVVNSGGLGSMGFGLAGAIGAHYATKKPVLCLESDGSFAMNPQDLAYISRNNLPIRVLIMDSLGYKSILLSQRRGEYHLAGIDEETGLNLLDPILVANAMGMTGEKVSISDNWRTRITNFLSATSPQLMQVIVSRDEEAAPRVISKPNAEGRMETAKLDDLWPPLSTEEIAEFVKPWMP